MSEQISAEMGERRRRREEERRRLVGGESGASPVTPPVTASAPEAPSQPLSRRELRERMAAPAQAGPQAPTRPGPQAPAKPGPQAPARPGSSTPAEPTAAAATPPRAVSGHAPMQPAPAPAPAAAQRPLSRRELREQAAAQRTPAGPAHPDPAQPVLRRPNAAATAASAAAPVPAPSQTGMDNGTRPRAAEGPSPALSPLSPQARAAAIRAQAARAQAEREEAAQLQAERVHIQRATAARRGNVAQGLTQAPGGQGVPEHSPPSMWTRQTGPEAGARSPAGRAAQPVAPPVAPAAAATAASARPGQMAPADPASLVRTPPPQVDPTPVRRVVLPPADTPVDPAAAGRDVRPGQRPATPAGTYTPSVVAYDPTKAHAHPAQDGGSSNGTSARSRARAGAAGADRRASDPTNGSAAQPAFVPAGIAPAVGQPFGTVAMPNGRTPAAPPVNPAAAGSAAASTLPAGQAFPTIQVPPLTGPTAPEASVDSGPVPQWGAVTSSPWTATSTVGSLGTATSTGASTDDTASVRGSFEATSGSEPFADEPEDATPPHPYTWLHMIVLVLVAFILGMLIYMAVSQDDPDDGAVGLPGVVDVPWDLSEGTGA